MPFRTVKGLFCVRHSKPVESKVGETEEGRARAGRWREHRKKQPFIGSSVLVCVRSAAAALLCPLWVRVFISDSQCSSVHSKTPRPAHQQPLDTQQPQRMKSRYYGGAAVKLIQCCEKVFKESEDVFKDSIVNTFRPDQRPPSWSCVIDMNLKHLHSTVHESRTKLFFFKLSSSLDNPDALDNVSRLALALNPWYLVQSLKDCHRNAMRTFVQEWYTVAHSMNTG